MSFSIIMGDRDRDRRFAKAMNDLQSANLFGIEGKLVEFHGRLLRVAKQY